MEVIETRAARLGAPTIAHGQHYHAMPERDGMIFQDESGLPATTAPDVATALQTILKTAPNARILICGSLYLAGRILQENG